MYQQEMLTSAIDRMKTGALRNDEALSTLAALAR
jgi:hypothetical protein